jgi:heptosyltransferase-2
LSETKQKANLVIQTAFLGDLLLSIPLLKKIKLQSPLPLILVCRNGVGDILLRTGLVDQVFEIKKGDKATYSKALENLKNFELDHVYVPHQSTRTHLFVSKLKAKTKIGFSNWWNFLVFDQRIERNKKLPDAIRQLSLASLEDKDLALKISDYEKTNRAFKLREDSKMSDPPTWASMSIREKLLDDKSTWSRFLERSGLSAHREKKWVLIFPGSVWATKKWTEEGFMDVAKKMQASGYEILLMGASDEKELCARIQAQVPGSHLLAGETSIYESALIISRAALAIGNDSASMHLASAAETPLVSIFGPTVIEFGYRPWSERAYLVQNTEISCRPCGPHGHRECPIGTHACMKQITSQKVLEVAQKAF